MRLNNLVSFSTTRELACCFGDWVLQAQVPLCKLVLVPGLLDTASLQGEAEVLALGGLYEVEAALTDTAASSRGPVSALFDREVPVSTIFDRALGAYLGLAIGDALGATVEFMTPREIALRFAAQGGVHRHIIGGGWLKLAPGQVTDDTTMSLALGQALLDGQRLGRPFDTVLIAEAFLAWWRGRPVDCGNTCRRGILRYRHDGSLSGPVNDADGGNGALMRNLPVALATLGDDALFERVALAQARVTHHHPLSDAAVLGIGHLLRACWPAPMPTARRGGRRLGVRTPGLPLQPLPRPRRRLRGRHRADGAALLHHAHRLRAAVVAAVNQGDDADTTGALVGMLAGARCGAGACRRTGCAGCRATWCATSPPRPVRSWRWRCRPPTP
jgi:ADP-ribosyl-[dinitrogen reductase] hydrolase